MTKEMPINIRSGHIILYLWSALHFCHASAESIIYTAKPETEPIVVATGNEATIVGCTAFESQIMHWSFDSADSWLEDKIWVD